MNETKLPPVELRCVECGASPLIIEKDKAIRCGSCGREYPRHRYRGIPVFLSTRTRLNIAEVLKEKGVDASASPRLAQGHWETTGLGRLLDGVPGTELLNHGCGDGDDRMYLEGRGYRVTGFDIYPAQLTNYIADGHELPFADRQFEIVTSVGVFGNLHDPFQGAREVARVMKPGGTLVGSVQFLESQLAHSYFHMSHDAIREIFGRAGFGSVEVYPGWSFLECLNRRFWVWNEISPIRKLNSTLCKKGFRAGMRLWRLAYKYRGTPMRDDLELSFSGSLIFRAVKK